MSARKKVMESMGPRTKADAYGALLVLDNGVRIESRSVQFPPAPPAGDYILVVDPDGYELGYWNAEEWEKDPKGVMGAILVCAATGNPAGEAPIARHPDRDAYQAVTRDGKPVYVCHDCRKETTAQPCDGCGQTLRQLYQKEPG